LKISRRYLIGMPAAQRAQFIASRRSRDGGTEASLDASKIAHGSSTASFSITMGLRRQGNSSNGSALAPGRAHAPTPIARRRKQSIARLNLPDRPIGAVEASHGARCRQKLSPRPPSEQARRRLMTPNAGLLFDQSVEILNSKENATRYIYAGDRKIQTATI